MHYSDLCSIKLPNDNRILVDLNQGFIETMIFGIYGIRSYGKSVVLQGDILASRGLDSFFSYDYMRTRLQDFDYVFFVYKRRDREETIKTNFNRAMRMSKMWGINKGILIDYNRFIEQTFTPEMYRSISNFYSLILKDYDFQISHIKDMKSLGMLKSRLENRNAAISRLIADKKMIDKERSEPQNVGIKKAIKTIENMSWIANVKQHPKGLALRTNQMQMSLVPNIGYSLDTDLIARRASYYTIFKNQCLGLNFVSPDAEYLIPYDMNVAALSSGSDDAVKKWIRNSLMFQGMNPHMGLGGKCYGEFASGISSAQKYGIDFLIMSLEGFLRSANLQDSAGKCVLNMPMGDVNGNITCWPYIDEVLNKFGIAYRGRRDYKTYLKLIKKLEIAMRNNPRVNINNLTTGMRSPNKQLFDANLQLIKEREPKVYEQIQKRIAEGAVL